MATRPTGPDGALVVRPEPREMRTAWTATAAVMASVIVLTAVVRVPRDGPLAIVEAAAGGAVVAALASLLHQLRVHREFIRLSPTSLSVRL